MGVRRSLRASLEETLKWNVGEYVVPALARLERLKAVDYARRFAERWSDVVALARAVPPMPEDDDRDATLGWARAEDALDRAATEFAREAKLLAAELRPSGSSGQTDLADPMSTVEVAALLARVGIGQEVEPDAGEESSRARFLKPLTKRTLRHRVEAGASGTVYSELRNAQLPDGKFDGLKVRAVIERLRAHVDDQRAQYEHERERLASRRGERNRATADDYERLAREALNLTGGLPVPRETGRTGTNRDEV